ncbi:unnamed protein product, partial [marine sediment metagenome]
IICCLFGSQSFAHERDYPAVIPVPNGFQPEGVVTGRGHKAYVGSLLNGAIYQTDLLSGEGDILIEGQQGKMAVGLAYDKRRKHLFVAGGINGSISVYDVKHGKAVAEFQTGTEGGFINDGIVTKHAAYFTDSFQPVLYKIPLSKKGEIPDETQLETLAMMGPRGGQFWDGRAATLEDQAKGPFLNPVEMNNPNKSAVIDDVKIADYAPLFEEVYGPDAFADVDIAYDNVADAIATYERTMEVNKFSSKYDAVQAGQDSFSPDEALGLHY